MTKIAIFASGSGSNAENITTHFKQNNDVYVEHIFCNCKNAFVIERAKKLDIPYTIFNREDLYKSNKIIESLIALKIDYIILAGFLWLVPSVLVEQFPNKIINIHPALLPNYGGKGMYGMNVHKSIIENKETESGITIHFVNNNYDEGDILFQAKCRIDENDTAESLAEKIHQLEQKYFPTVIEQTIEKYSNI